MSDEKLRLSPSDISVDIVAKKSELYTLTNKRKSNSSNQEKGALGIWWRKPNTKKFIQYFHFYKSLEMGETKRQLHLAASKLLEIDHFMPVDNFFHQLDCLEFAYRLKFKQRCHLCSWIVCFPLLVSERASKLGGLFAINQELDTVMCLSRDIIQTYCVTDLKQ